MLDADRVKIITDEEYMVVKNHALLPLVLKALIYDKKLLTASHLKFINEYLIIIDAAIVKCQKAITQNRQDIFYCHIRIVDHDWLNHEMMFDNHPYPIGFDKESAVKWIRDTAAEYFKASEDMM
ncbi:hypothetical protein [Sporolactobacillus pectinivorans]|uniref:hypothetical protein n=1 Tax=Sporolactobacillus pectinivorans TaxID=1591408 RepID=UPI000C25DBC4|nr:hypothetical protein [Sporolactobacillus pectinivorans]